MKRALSLVADALLVVLAQILMLPVWAYYALAEGVDIHSRAYRAALLWDLAVGALAGADEGETFSTYMARLRPARLPCLFCALVAIAWPGHCDQAAGVKFILRKE